VGDARRALETVRVHDRALGELADRLAEVAAALADVTAELASYASAVDADPTRLAAVEERRAALTALTRRYGSTVDDVLDWSREASLRLLALEGDDERRSALEAERSALRAELAELGARISAARMLAGQRLGAAVSAELAELAMPQAVLAVRLRQAEAADGLHLPDGPPGAVAFGRSGIDEVELLLTPHADAPARPLSKGASGGELSRLMLALEVVLAGADPVPTLVFDEIDAGIGGRAAVEVGRRLARLARSHQVLVVTHLPQVAAFADRQVVVEKSDDGRVTATGLRVVEGDERVRELSRMLAGLEDSASAADHARELLALAAAERQGHGSPTGTLAHRPARRRKPAPSPARSKGASA
jgi:DNA repair protein RecN (Recombination protein N)